jgi:serine/threonine-protein kinase
LASDHTRPDRVKILDFGIAKLEGSQLTQTGGVGGTLAYMSPEHLREKTLDPRTDLWSLGVVLYEMLAGEPPFGSEIPSEVLQAILERQPPPLKSRRPEVGDRLERLVAKALAKAPAERHASAAELAGELETVLRRMQA